MTQATRCITVLDGRGLSDLVAAGCRALEANRDEINALNVFPVPDGDTGTNMALTVRAVVEDVGPRAERRADAAARGLARAALLAARGNSGLILAQFFKGIAAGLADASEMRASHLAEGFRQATEAAYRAVPDPVEGTMLTVIREAGDAVRSRAGEVDDLVQVWAAAAEQAASTVALTPTMLDVLRQAGVVDAGGYGFQVMLAGVLSYLRGHSDGAVVLHAPSPVGVGNGARAGVRESFLAAAQDEVWGYCTSFVIEGAGLDPDAVRARASAMGKSCVVAGDERQVRIHIHPRDPGPVISYGVTLGTISRVSVLNMDEQTREWAQARRAESGRQTDISIVAVAAGRGMHEVFATSSLGACRVLNGGDTMNPSTAELLAAVEESPGKDVILLPNNKNILATAHQVPGLTRKNAVVIPTRTVQAGVAALLAFSLDQGLDANVAAMKEAADSVRAGAVTRATRDVVIDGVRVRAGQMIALLDDAIVCAGDDAGSVLLDLLRSSRARGDLITLYCGEGVDDDAAARIAGSLREHLPGVELDVIDAGQPHYPFLIAIE